MTCTKQLVLTGFRVQYIDLREPKPRTPMEEIYVVDSQWTGAMGFLGLNLQDGIKKRYEFGGYHVISIQPLKPKRVAEVDLCQLWQDAEPPILEPVGEEAAEA